MNSAHLNSLRRLAQKYQHLHAFDTCRVWNATTRIPNQQLWLSMAQTYDWLESTIIYIVIILQMLRCGVLLSAKNKVETGKTACATCKMDSLAEIVPFLDVNSQE